MNDFWIGFFIGFGSAVILALIVFVWLTIYNLRR